MTGKKTTGCVLIIGFFMVVMNIRILQKRRFSGSLEQKLLHREGPIRQSKLAGWLG